MKILRLIVARPDGTVLYVADAELDYERLEMDPDAELGIMYESDPMNPIVGPFRVTAKVMDASRRNLNRSLM